MNSFQRKSEVFWLQLKSSALLDKISKIAEVALQQKLNRNTLIIIIFLIQCFQIMFQVFPKRPLSNMQPKNMQGQH